MSKNKHSMKNIFMTFILLVIMYKIVRNPNQSINSAREGLNLWFNLLIPSLYPFIFITDLLVSFGIINSITKYFDPLMVSIFNVPGIGAFPFSMSIMSGYPIGARLTSKLRKERYISKIDADRLISFSSTSGPLFILGTVLIGMMGGPNVSALMIIPHYLGAITVGVIFRFYKRKDSLISTNNYQYNNRSHLDKEALENKSVGSLIYKSIKDSMESIISIGGFVIIYSVIIDILLSFQLFNSLVGVISQLTSIDANIIKGIIAGIIEMTNGCEIISNLNIDLIIKVIILNLIIGWGGFSIHSQALSFISSTDISPKIYLISKFLHGIFSAIYTYVLYLLFYKNITMKTYINSMPTFNTYTSNNFVKLFIISTSIVIVSTICLSLLNVFINECRKRA
ncbi:MAG: sporulation integral membrane protein YlbJ [Tissierellia bacterium]|nr:sporulation integral membrane protein YlbJ [Tissierellia bacterium]MDD4725751.1 sporulation integral membrane protein YlbJ [Tissierellia bacterium]